MAITTFDIQLESVQQLTSDVKHFVFSRVDGKLLEYIPGQFINLYFERDGKRHSRSYSIATIPGESSFIEIAISLIPGGIASDSLQQLMPGQPLPAAGPVGRLVLKAEEKPKRYILVGTGTGMAPYRAMLPSLSERLAADPNLQIILLLGVRNKAQSFYTDDFIKWANQHPQAQFFACYSQELPQEAQSWEWGGRVTSFLSQLTLNPTEDILYLCGNPAMIDDAYEMLQLQGFDHKNVKREKYVISGS